MSRDLLASLRQSAHPYSASPNIFEKGGKPLSFTTAYESDSQSDSYHGYYGDGHEDEETGEGDIAYEKESMYSQSGRSHISDMETNPNSNFKVVIRVRPPLPRELSGDKPFQNVVKLDSSGRVITISEGFGLDGSDAPDGIYTAHQLTFDRVYGPTAKQKEVYENTAREVVMSTLQGFSACIIAYGQSGTGKTYTMEGFTSDEQRGIIPRATEEIFDYIQNCPNPRCKFLVRASYLQIYNEVISDLLKPERRNLMIREDKRKGVFVEGLSEWVVRSPAEIYGLMERGTSVRATGATRMNDMSSRSHAVFQIIVEQSEIVEEPDEDDPRASARKIGDVRQSFKIGKLNLVDLAGSERVRYTGATGVRLEESKKINQSLSALGNVIAALTDSRGRQHIPYRDSKLTRILEDSLGGNCKTTMMAMISPALEAFSESLSTLKFANRAKNIKNEAHINEDLDQRALLRKYERELKKLRAELQEKSRNVVDKRRLLELEEQKRRAEEDKLAAITALEKRSREFMAEKEEKRKLEERILMMQSQLLVGGQTIEDTPQFRNALQQEYQRVHKEYADRLAEIERERQNIEEDKAQVDRYKQLLLKQRDIMIALTARLNERDESILALQEELDAYDRHQRMLEDTLDQKTAALIHLQKVTMELTASSPVKNPMIMQALGEWGDGMSASGGPLSAQLFPPQLAASASSGSLDQQQQGALAPQIGDREVMAMLAQRQEEVSRLAAELEDVKAEKVSLEYLLREKIEKIVQSEIEDKIAAHKREIEHWKASCSLAEEKRRATEYILDLLKLNSAKESGGSEFESKVTQIVQKEMEQVKRPYLERIGKLTREADEREQERTNLLVTIERMKAEVEKAQDLQARGLLPSSSGGLPDQDRLIRRLEVAETEAKELKVKLQLLNRLKSSPNESTSPSPVEEAGSTSTDSQKVKQLESRIEAMKQQQLQFRQEVSVRLEEKTALAKRLEEENKRLAASSGGGSGTSSSAPAGDEEVASLRMQVANSAKERKALKTILEAKIKVMVDSVASALDPATQDPRVARDIQALQKLVNASIAALK